MEVKTREKAIALQVEDPNAIAPGSSLVVVLKGRGIDLHADLLWLELVANAVSGITLPNQPREIQRKTITVDQFFRSNELDTQRSWQNPRCLLSCA